MRWCPGLLLAVTATFAGCATEAGAPVGEPGAAGGGTVAAPPNILWLVVEDMSPWLACYGDATVPTPTLDRLAAESVRYVNAFATSPVCAPARSSLITGMYATRIGTMHMRTGNPSGAALARDASAYDGIPSYQGVPPDWGRCFPERLRAAGYFCTNNAKTDYQFEAPATVWDASGGQAHWRDRAAGQPFFAVFNHGGTHESRAFPDSAPAPSVVAPEDVAVPPLYPDTPAVRDALARSYDNIARMDAWVGRQLDALEAAGLAGSTWVFFYSDHGVGLPRGKRSPYDLGTRVPLLVRAPGGTGAGTTEERVVSFVDFGPSVLSLAGLEPDARLDGVPFLGAHARRGRGLAFAHADRFDSVYDRARSVSDGRFRYVRNLVTDRGHLLDNAYRRKLPMMADLDALRESGAATAAQWQVVSTGRPAEELYDTASDPWEVRNLAEDPRHAQRLVELRAALDRWLEETGDLGLVLPEQAMVAERLWPGLEQPETAAAEVTVTGAQVRIRCATSGASLGWRIGGEGPWTVYTGPFAVPDAAAVEVLAHRIGYAPSVNLHPLP
jgi:arylsulfatase A-like enzyme